MPDEFHPADAVELIGGDGHRMIVEDVQDGIVSCVWVRDGVAVRGSFPAAALKLSEKRSQKYLIGAPEAVDPGQKRRSSYF